MDSRLPFRQISECNPWLNLQLHLSRILRSTPRNRACSPFVFIFVNDIPEFVQCKIRLYADDILLYSEINSLDDCLRLQTDIENLFLWSKQWQLYFNPAKCEFLRITNKRNPISYSYTMDNSSIKEVHAAKYLGVTIDSKLTWSVHISSVVNKAINSRLP